MTERWYVVRQRDVSALSEHATEAEAVRACRGLRGVAVLPQRRVRELRDWLGGTGGGEHTALSEHFD